MKTADVVAPAAQLRLEVGAAAEDRPAQAAEPLSVKDRRELVAVLYPEETTEQLGRRFGVSSTTIRNDLIYLGKARVPAHARTTNPILERRPCACGCGRWFRPPRRKPGRKFAKRKCSDRGRRAAPNAILPRSERQAESMRLYVQEGLDFRTIAQRLGVTAMTVRADLLAAGEASRRRGPRRFDERFRRLVDRAWRPWSGQKRRTWKLRWTRSPGRPRSYTDSQAEWVLSLATKGYGHERIVQTTGLSRDTVRRIRGREKSA